MGGLIYIPWEQHPVSHTLATCGSSPPLCVQIWGVSPMRLFREGGRKWQVAGELLPPASPEGENLATCRGDYQGSQGFPISPIY